MSSKLLLVFMAVMLLQTMTWSLPVNILKDLSHQKLSPPQDDIPGQSNDVTIGRLRRHAHGDPGTAFLNKLMEDIRKGPINTTNKERWMRQLTEALQRGVVSQDQVNDFIVKIREVMSTGQHHQEASPFWL